MRLFFAIILIALNSALGFGQEAEFSIKKPTHKFPKAKPGVVLKHEFEITNTGKSPLIISDYSVACECTKVILPGKPIPPGATFKLPVTFDTAGKAYYQDRIIYLKTNTKKGKESLRIKLYVYPE